MQAPTKRKRKGKKSGVKGVGGTRQSVFITTHGKYCSAPAMSSGCMFAAKSQQQDGSLVAICGLFQEIRETDEADKNKRAFRCVRCQTAFR